MNIAIIGCGYLGYELAKELYSKGHFVTCTTSNPDSIKKLIPITNKSFVMMGNDEKEMSLILKNNDVIIVTVSTNHDNFEETFLQTAKTIKKCALELNEPKIIIYTSKSSLYGNHEGMWVDESSELKANDEKSKILIETENVLFSLKELKWKICILRLAQIYGPQREILDLFKTTYKKIIPGHGEYYTNMINLQDVVGIILFLLEHNIEGIFNAVDDEHPTRQEFANLLCSKLKLAEPKYDPNIADFPDYNKRVANYRIKEMGYIFKYSKRNF